MRFLLLEAEPSTQSQPTPEANTQVSQPQAKQPVKRDADTEAAEREEKALRGLEQEWKTADNRRREVILSQILQKLGDNPQERQALTILKGAFRASCAKYGIEFARNPFMSYLQKLVSNSKIKVSAKHNQYIFQLVLLSESDIFLRNRIKLAGNGNRNAAYLLNPSLFYRSAQDFNYTVQVFETVLNPSKLHKFFKDTSDISVDQLYDGRDIKPAGNASTANDINTIFGQVEAWSGENGENDGGDNELSTNDGETHSSGFSKAGDKKQQAKIPNLSRLQLQKIKESPETHFTSLEAADKAGVKDGQVVYIDFNKDMTTGGMGSDNWFDTWMVKKNGKWQKYGV